jgi:presenilin-like A22 family membrane protease
MKTNTKNKIIKNKKIKTNTKKSKECQLQKNKIVKKNKFELKKNLKNLNYEALFILLIIFIITQILGLFVAHSLNSSGLSPELFEEDFNSVWNAIYLFISILLMTTILLFLFKLKKKKQTLIIFESLAIFMTSLIIFEILFGSTIGLFLTITIVLWRLVYRNNILFRNFVGILAIAGAGGLIGLSLGLIPIITFITILAIYDFIAVFKTKHMVKLGKEVTQGNYAFTIAIPTKKHKFELGNGDLVIPLIVASSILINGPFKNNLLVTFLVLIASYIGLAISIQSVSILKQPLPALPPQTILILIIIGISFIFGV